MTRQDKYNRLCELMKFKVPKDGLLTAISGKLQLSVIDLDKNLEKRGFYRNNENKSMNEIIEDNFGIEALNLVNELTDV